MKVSELLNILLKYNHEVNSIKTDSRKIKKNDIFIVVVGDNHNGFDYIEEAVNNKAKTIISDSEELYNYINLYPKVNFVVIKDIKVNLPIYLKKLHKDILTNLTLIGVTGTNGKTTITTLLYKYFRYLGKNVTLIGTNGVYINDDYYKSFNTTPEIVDIYNYLNLSYQKEVKYVILEVSSHGIKDCRIKGLDFEVGLLTNITLDHLDYHKTMDDYFYTKLLFINTCIKKIVNCDDLNYSKIRRCLKEPVKTYGHEIKYVNIDYKIASTHLDIIESNFDIIINDTKYFINSSLLGEYNVSNITGFIAILNELEMFNQYTLSFLRKKIVIDGRFESIKSNRGTFIIDFAHTPDSITKILEFVNKVKLNKVITVVGMGGDRDNSKRSIVGSIVTTLSDKVIITSDNPRKEDPLQIIEDIKSGVSYENKSKYIIEIDRRKAIELAYKMSRCDDLILILGKGNEKYQIIGNTYFDYNDKEEVLKCINKQGD